MTTEIYPALPPLPLLAINLWVDPTIPRCLVPLVLVLPFLLGLSPPLLGSLLAPELLVPLLLEVEPLELTLLSILPNEVSVVCSPLLPVESTV